MLPADPILRQAAERVTARLDTGLVPYSEQEALIFAGRILWRSSVSATGLVSALRDNSHRSRMNGRVMQPG